MADVSQIRQELVDRTKRDFESLLPEDITPQSLRGCAEHQVRALSEHRYQILLDNFRVRSWAPPDIYIESSGLQATDSTQAIKKVVAAEVVRDIVHDDPEWCRQHQIDEKGLVAPETP